MTPEPPKPIVVIGAGGLVGSTVVDSLRKRGLPVVPVAHTPGVSGVDVDVTDLNAVTELMHAYAPECVIHAAYLLADRTESDPRRALAVNAVGFLNVIEACARTRVRSFLYASSIAVYRNQRVRRDDAAVTPTTAYGAMKVLNERQAHDMRAQFVRCSSVRIANVYANRLGLGQTGWLQTAVHDALAGKEVRVDLAPDAKMAVIWAADLADRLAAMVVSGLDTPWPEIVNSGAEPISGRQLAARLLGAGARSVALGRSRYAYPSSVASPWLDAIAGAGVTRLETALACMRPHPATS